MTEKEQNKLVYERKCIEMGHKLIAGTDEVGRGPLAGPAINLCPISIHLRS